MIKQRPPGVSGGFFVGKFIGRKHQRGGVVLAVRTTAPGIIGALVLLRLRRSCRAVMPLVSYNPAVI